MLPARKRVYTVKYVIEAVQNGESDFEMESDISESSEEEVDEDAGPVDKQNQTPIDCPADDDEDVEPSKPSQTTHRTMPRDRYRWLKKDFTSPCTDFSGPDVTSGAVSLKMGLTQMSGVRMYWETDSQYTPISDVMSRNRFQSLLTSLHSVNNLTVSETQKKDKLWKLRPWLASVREKCLLVVPEEHNSVDEMMVPFKGKFSGIKQYLRGKPHPWGFK